MMDVCIVQQVSGSGVPVVWQPREESEGMESCIAQQQQQGSGSGGGRLLSHPVLYSSLLAVFIHSLLLAVFIHSFIIACLLSRQ